MRMWKRFPQLFEAVKADHERAGLFRGHDIYHALRVAEWALRIAYDEWSDRRLAELAGIAGLCYNADHIIREERGDDMKPEETHSLVERWLAHTLLTPEETETVIAAVMGHAGINSDTDSRVLIALMDADRVVNLDSDVIIRSGRYHTDVPAIDYVHFLQDPEATYLEPKSTLRDISHCLDWIEEGGRVCVRTRLGKELGKERALFLQTFFGTIEKQLTDVGLLPYPFE